MVWCVVCQTLSLGLLNPRSPPVKADALVLRLPCHEVAYHSKPIPPDAVVVAANAGSDYLFVPDGNSDTVRAAVVSLRIVLLEKN